MKFEFGIFGCRFSVFDSVGNRCSYIFWISIGMADYMCGDKCFHSIFNFGIMLSNDAADSVMPNIPKQFTDLPVAIIRVENEWNLTFLGDSFIQRNTHWIWNTYIVHRIRKGWSLNLLTRHLRMSISNPNGIKKRSLVHRCYVKSQTIWKLFKLLFPSKLLFFIEHFAAHLFSLRSLI